MKLSGRGSLGRSVVVGLILVGHIVFLLLLAGLIDRRRLTAPADTTVLVLMDLELQRPVAAAPGPPGRPRPAGAPAPAPSTAISEPPVPSGAPGGTSAPVDWSGEATRAAAAASGRLSTQSQQECHPEDRRGPLPAHCLQPRAPAPWEPEPARAGFSGGLPWVRIGKECIVGLGFFGCALDPPPANGHVLDEMKNPDRLRSSVPDVPR